MIVPRRPAGAGMGRLLQLVPPLTAMLVMVVGLMVLGGWGLRLPPLTSVVAPLPAMMPNTAVAFVLAGAGLWLLGPQHASPGRRRAGRGLGLGVALFGLVVLGEYLAGWQPGLDQWLFAGELAGLGMRFPGRPSPHSAAAFVLVGLALALLDADRRRGFRPAKVLAPLSATVALVALLGYVYRVRYLYGLSQVSGMALHTAVTFLVLNTGLLACRPDRQPTRTFLAAGPGGLLARRLVPALLLVPLGVGVLVLLGERARLFEPAFGTAVTTVAMLATLTAVVAVTARDLDRAEWARRGVQEDLLEAEQRFRRVTDAATDAIVSADIDGVVRTWSKGAERMFGWRAEEVIGAPLTAIIPARLRASHQQGLARVRQTGHSRLAGNVVELVALRRDGSEFPVELSIGMWQSKQGQWFSGVIRDITSRKQAEQALQKANQALQDAKQTAEQANQAKSEYLARMSHELRTPLNAILGFAQLLELDQLTEDQRDSLRHILSGARHLLALINEVLDIAAIEAGRLHLSLEPVAVADVVGEAVSLIRPLADQHGILLVSPTQPGTEQVLVDRRRCKQILLNLLSNAVKYNRKGGSVHLVCEPAPEERLRIKVVDTGPGIARELIKRLFVPFERLESDVTREVEGTGLGLPMAQRLAEAMGGSLGVASAVGHGSTFWVQLPLTDAPIQHPGRQHISPPPEQEAVRRSAAPP
jgi:PAS domain S-box-containing protein